MSANAERKDCITIPVKPECFNPNCHLPYGLTVEHVRQAMEEFIDFLGFINQQLHSRGVPPRPFCFKGVYAAKLDKSDWSFSGRSEISRRTITASVTQSGVEKMKTNWVYDVSR